MSTIVSMQKRGTLLGAFALLFLVTLAIIFLFSIPLFQPVRGAMEWALVPIQRVLHISGTSIVSLSQDEQVRQLQEENGKLRKQLIDQTKLQEDTKALRDQFAITTISSRKLSPATIVGVHGFIPGVSLPQKLIIDKGENDGVKVGMVVISGDSVVGIVKKNSQHLSEVLLVVHDGSSITATTLDTQATGVVNGTNEGMRLDNVILSETLTIGDTVVTKGDVDGDGRGYPKGLIIGKIISVNKKASDLFQTAVVQSVIDVAKLTTVFVITE